MTNDHHFLSRNAVKNLRPTQSCPQEANIETYGIKLCCRREMTVRAASRDPIFNYQQLVGSWWTGHLMLVLYSFMRHCHLKQMAVQGEISPRIKFMVSWDFDMEESIDWVLLFWQPELLPLIAAWWPWPAQQGHSCLTVTTRVSKVNSFNSWIMVWLP